MMYTLLIVQLRYQAIDVLTRFHTFCDTVKKYLSQMTEFLSK